MVDNIVKSGDIMFTRIGIDVINSLTISELDILRYIDNNKKEILDMSIQDLSKSVFFSTTSIIRLCKKIGFSGFSELKYYVKEEVKKAEQNLVNETFESILDNNVNSIVETAKLLDKDKVNEIVDLMLKKEKIHFFGKGLTSTVLEYASKQLLTCNKANFNYQDTHIAYLACESMNENDILIVCSLSGNTHQVVRAAQIAKSRNAKVITITKNVNNELSKIGDINISICSDNNPKSISDISSRVPMLFVLNIIITFYIKKKNG